MKKLARPFLFLITAGILLALISPVSAGQELRRTAFQVGNLSCSSCLGSINTGLRELGGVVAMDGNVQKRIVVVDHQRELDVESIASLISELGYPAEVVSTGIIDAKYQGLFTINTRSAGSGCGGCGTAGYCNASSSSWKALYRKYIQSRQTAQK